MELFLGQAPLYLGIWLISFVVILFVSRFLLKKAFTPSEEMIKSQKDFVAAASHELKAPLAVIMAMQKLCRVCRTMTAVTRRHRPVWMSLTQNAAGCLGL
mgnify:CR=1 FL=1